MDELTDIVVDRKRLTLFELLEMLEAKDDKIPQEGLDVALLPPLNAVEDVTDEDSGPEDNPTIDNAPKSQLHSEVIVSLPVELYSQASSDQCTSASKSKIDPQSNTRQTSRKSKLGKSFSPPESRRKVARKAPTARDWSQTELPRPMDIFPEFDICMPEKGKSPEEYFRLFMDDEVLNLFVNFSNLYATKHNLTGNITKNEILIFIAILLLSGYNSVSRKVMYWEKSRDSHNDFVSGAMSRDRFQFIMSNLHVCDNANLEKSDRFGKVRPLLNMLNSRFLDFLPHENFHSVDESMVPYYGGHGAKQFIRGKPIRFGYKFWCGGTSSGYLTWLEPYQGANTCSEKYRERGLGYSVVMSYIDVLPKDIPYKLFFDNLFTSIDLLTDLKSRNILASGTIRANRLGKNCPLTDVSIMQKMERGKWECATDMANNISIIHWNDNNIVSVATNFDRVHPLKHANRYSREKKKKVVIPQPVAINTYNLKMGGIDRADQNISLYRVSIRGKKWYFPLIAHLIDVCENNAWQIYQRFEAPIDHLMFRRKVALAILETNQRITPQCGRHSKKREVETRYDRTDHLVCSLPKIASGKKQQLMCRLYNKKATTKCIKCDVTLHVDCFINFHTKV